ncbi:unnamed protein product [Amoebophrya sp. A25]|nr:unnamed protein product [Amoebophrya sp. A25]|eukprot:GSA25T00001947001.1
MEESAAQEIVVEEEATYTKGDNPYANDHLDDNEEKYVDEIDRTPDQGDMDQTGCKPDSPCGEEEGRGLHEGADAELHDPQNYASVDFEEHQHVEEEQHLREDGANEQNEDHHHEDDLQHGDHEHEVLVHEEGGEEGPFDQAGPFEKGPFDADSPKNANDPQCTEDHDQDGAGPHQTTSSTYGGPNAGSSATSGTTAGEQQASSSKAVPGTASGAASGGKEQWKGRVGKSFMGEGKGKFAHSVANLHSQGSTPMLKGGGGGQNFHTGGAGKYGGGGPGGKYGGGQNYDQHSKGGYHKNNKGKMGDGKMQAGGYVDNNKGGYNHKDSGSYNTGAPPQGMNKGYNNSIAGGGNPNNIPLNSGGGKNNMYSGEHPPAPGGGPPPYHQQQGGAPPATYGGGPQGQDGINGYMDVPHHDKQQNFHDGKNKGGKFNQGKSDGYGGKDHYGKGRDGYGGKGKGAPAGVRVLSAEELEDFSLRRPEAYKNFTDNNVYMSNGLYEICLRKCCPENFFTDFLDCFECWLKKSHGMSGPYHLRKLDLSGNNLGNHALRTLCTKLKQHTVRLDLLNLSGNLFDSMEDLVSYLWQMERPLLALGLKSNRLTAEEVNAVLRCCYNHENYPSKSEDGRSWVPLRLELSGNPCCGDSLADLFTQVYRQGKAHITAEKLPMKDLPVEAQLFLAVHCPSACTWRPPPKLEARRRGAESEHSKPEKSSKNADAPRGGGRNRAESERAERGGREDRRERSGAPDRAADHKERRSVSTRGGRRHEAEDENQEVFEDEEEQPEEEEDERAAVVDEQEEEENNDEQDEEAERSSGEQERVRTKRERAKRQRASGRDREDRTTSGRTTKRRRSGPAVVERGSDEESVDRIERKVDRQEKRKRNRS